MLSLCKESISQTSFSCIFQIELSFVHCNSGFDSYYNKEWLQKAMGCFTICWWKADYFFVLVANIKGNWLWLLLIKILLFQAVLDASHLLCSLKEGEIFYNNVEIFYNSFLYLVCLGYYLHYSTNKQITNIFCLEKMT